MENKADGDLTPGVVNAPHEQRPGNVSEFKKLPPAVFSSTEKPLDVEQWLIGYNKSYEGSSNPRREPGGSG